MMSSESIQSSRTRGLSPTTFTLGAGSYRLFVVIRIMKRFIFGFLINFFVDYFPQRTGHRKFYFDFDFDIICLIRHKYVFNEY
jgi:hypothetical protein